MAGSDRTSRVQALVQSDFEQAVLLPASGNFGLRRSADRVEWTVTRSAKPHEILQSGFPPL